MILETFTMLVRAMIGFVVVLGGWLLIQAFVRKQKGCSHGEDPLDFMPGGCAGCKNAGPCKRRKAEAEEEHHELV